LNWGRVDVEIVEHAFVNVKEDGNEL
jgi:hypothetical protein